MWEVHYIGDQDLQEFHKSTTCQWLNFFSCLIDLLSTTQSQSKIFSVFTIFWVSKKLDVCNLHSLQKSSGLWNFLLFKAYPELLPISVLFLCGKLFTYGIFLPPWSTFINITLHKVFMDRKTFCKSLMTNNSQCCTRCPALKSVIPHNYYYFK